MDAEYTNEFRRKFDEDDVNHRREKILENINRHFYKKNPELLDATHLTVSKSSRSVLDLCGIRFTKTVNCSPSSKTRNPVIKNYSPQTKRRYTLQAH